MRIIPTILGRSETEVHEQTKAFANATHLLHLDVMDGQFVPEITPQNLGDLLDPKFAYDLHMMVTDPASFLHFMHAGNIHCVYAHAELSAHTLHHFFDKAHEIPVRLGLALNLDTPLEEIRHFTHRIFRVLLMSIVPGDYGRSIDNRITERIAQVRQMYPDLEICVDGGINHHTLPLVKGADQAGAHSALFGQQVSPAEALLDLDRAAQSLD